MIHVNTEVRESKIAGVGLFAAQDIMKGTIIWEHTSQTTLSYANKEDFLASHAGEEHYGYVKDNIWYFNLDDGKYMNHSFSPNTLYDHIRGVSVASRDITCGEEITSHYMEFDDEFPEYSNSYV